jgi:hypothetical protein
MKNTKNTGTGNKNAQAALAEINEKIVELQQQRVSLAQPLKDRYAEIAKELTDMATQIRELDPSWKPASLRPKADTKIIEILTQTSRERIAVPRNIPLRFKQSAIPWSV